MNLIVTAGGDSIVSVSSEEEPTMQQQQQQIEYMEVEMVFEDEDEQDQHHHLVTDNDPFFPQLSKKSILNCNHISDHSVIRTNAVQFNKCVQNHGVNSH